MLHLLIHTLRMRNIRLTKIDYGCHSKELLTKGHCLSSPREFKEGKLWIYLFIHTTLVLMYISQLLPAFSSVACGNVFRKNSNESLQPCLSLPPLHSKESAFEKMYRACQEEGKNHNSTYPSAQLNIPIYINRTFTYVKRKQKILYTVQMQ